MTPSNPHRKPIIAATALFAVLALTVTGVLLYLTHGQGPAPVAVTSPTPAATSSAAQSPRFTPYTIPTRPAGLAEITPGPDGALWFTEDSASKVGRISTSGAITEYPVPNPSNIPASGPVFITSGPDGAVWFTETGSNTIGRIATTGQVAEYPIPTAQSFPEGITTGPGGALWFTEETGNNIGRITTSGKITEFPLPRRQAVQCGYLCPLDIVAGPDGALWFTESQFTVGGGNRIGRMTLQGQLTEYVIPTPNSLPDHIIAGTSDDLWFTEDRGRNIGHVTTSGQVSEFPLPGNGNPVRAAGLTIGPDKALWFGIDGQASVSPLVGRLGRLAADGTSTTYTDPNADLNGPIVLGPDRNLWAIDASDGVIWKISLPS